MSGTSVAAYQATAMKHLAWLGLVLVLTACGSNGSGLSVTDGSADNGGSGGGGGSTGGAGGGPIKVRPDGSIVDPGTGGSTGTGGAIGIDAGPLRDAGKADAQPSPDADMCMAGTCDDLMKAYAQAIQQELACDPTAPNQCLKQTQSALACGCTIFVNTTVLSDAVRKKFDEAGCQKCLRFTACPAIACIPPKAALCQPVSAQADRPIIAPPVEKGQCMSKYMP